MQKTRRLCWRSCAHCKRMFKGAAPMRRTQLIVISVMATRTILGQNSAQDATPRGYGRAMVVSTGGIVATSQYLASQAGAQILARGGSAIDAAVAANAV